jgi:vanillate O-demethylase ferredoxin subunit
VLGILKERQSRGGSIFMHDNVQTGDFLSIGRPRCNFPLVESAELSVLIAGGIGATPLLAMAHRLAALGKPFAFHYCARNRSRIAFRDVLEHSPLVGSVTLHLSDGDAKQRFFLPDDVGLPERGVHIYICGPEGFIAKQLDQAAALGWPDDQVHVEFFNAQVRSEAGDQPIVVTAARSGVTVEVRANQTIANVLMESGVDVPVACEQGICGTCVTPILQGKPLHRDEYLSDAEKSSNKMMTICCSRAKSRSLVLDI